MYKLSNQWLSVQVSPVGAELCSLYSPVTDIEYLWQPGYETWPHSSMLLFPNPGRIARGRTVIDGKVYPANMHGFAAELPFTEVVYQPDRLVLELKDCPETRNYFPYSFVLQVEFLLWGEMLVQTFRVMNRGDKTMYYGLGGHPGFYCPLVLGEKAEDYSLIFDCPQKLDQLELEENTRLLTGKQIPYMHGQSRIPLHERFFDNGPMLFTGMDAKTVTLQSRRSGRFVEMGIAGFPDLCLWGVPTRMSLIAIEPWIGTTDRADTDHIWEHKPHLQCLQSGQENTHRLTFRVG